MTALRATLATVKSPDVDVPALQARVLEIGTARDCEDFAEQVQSADVDALLARADELERGYAAQAEIWM